MMLKDRQHAMQENLLVSMFSVSLMNQQQQASLMDWV
jgi:hypothetical protein